MSNVTAILTCHKEGLLLGPTLGSLEQAVSHAIGAGLSVDVLVVLDKANAVTQTMISQTNRGYSIMETELGDPGQARNAGVENSRSEFVAFLDGDDLWSANWLTDAVAFAQQQEGPVICHSAANVVFGTANQIWWHADSQDPAFDPDYLWVANYWDAMCLTRRETMAAHPFVANDLKIGYGHEDWHWNCTTLSAGVAHRPVPGTLHFKRRRKGSQMSLCDDADVVVRSEPVGADSTGVRVRRRTASPETPEAPGRPTGEMAKRACGHGGISETSRQPRIDIVGCIDVGSRPSTRLER